MRFKVKGEENTWLYAWTTTPWTLPSNVALCVNPDETYARFDFDGRTVIMAQALIPAVLGEDATVENLATMPGRDLVGMEYEPLFDFQKPLVNKPAWRVVADSYVTMTDGTGIVHQAPGLWRGRRPRRPRKRLALPPVGGHTRPHGQGDALGGHVCQGRRPAHP